ncbi:unnamed protein product [Danaus chrysippus]|uniref:(African queen) hypothetical protein n=1 Tax=Danaus chrysippus TaxID=151541 RepID=A0A8J2W5J8_9NEOP|nr:unnamed protein product [Danaus chrysippus]
MQNYEKNTERKKNDVNIITNTVAEIVGDNGSDDDVIEVVRDEAPIEILSDGEEMEIQKSKHIDVFTHTYKEFNLTQQATDTGSEDKLYRQEETYKKSCIAVENSLHAYLDTVIELPVCTTSNEDASKTDDKSNHDSSGENCFVNVTDVVNSSDNEAEKLKQTVKEELELKQASGFSIDIAVKEVLDPVANLANDVGARFALMNGRRVLLIGEYRFMRHYEGVEVIHGGGYPKLMYCGFLYRPHNAYRQRRLQLWYCKYRNTRQCRAIIRTMDALVGTGVDCFASYCLSKQGKMGITLGGYRFRFNGCARNGKIRWRCSRGPWCKAALHTYRGRIVYIQSTHNCGPKPPT